MASTGAIIFLSLVAFSAVYLNMLGVFKTMDIQEVNIPVSELYYRPYLGTFDMEMASEFYLIQDHLKNNTLATRANNAYGANQLFGIYYDNPDYYEPGTHLRADIGFMADTSSFSSVEKAQLDREMGKLGYKHAATEKTRAVYETMPVRFPDVVGYILGPQKFYPAAKKYLDEHPNLPSQFHKGINIDCGAFEIYTGDMIHFYVPVQNHEQFYLTTSPKPTTKKANPGDL